MTTITVPRVVLEQALEALSFSCPAPHLMSKHAAAEAALRAALAEPENWELRRLREELERCKQTCAAISEAWREEAALAEPVEQGCEHCNQPLYAAIKCRVCGRVTPIIEPEIKVDNEPVAWIHTDPDNPRVKFLEWREDEPGYRGRWIKTPLYTSPQR